MKYIEVGKEVIRGYLVASFPYANKEEAWKYMRECNYPLDQYAVKFYQGNWYIMAVK